MANQRISKDKRALVISGLVEGLPIRAVCRAFGVGKNGVKRIIEETGEALADYMARTFRNLRSERLEIDEQWQYVGQHGQRMRTKEAGKGDFWVWCALDPDSKLVVAYRVGSRRSCMAEELITDLSKRVPGEVQITTDQNPNYLPAIRGAFGSRAHYATETKEFHDPREWDPKAWPAKRKNGVPKIAKAHRKEVLGNPDLGTSTTAHVERVFLSVRQELARFSRLTLAYSKDLRMHKLGTHLHYGIYNLVRRNAGISGLTPAQAAGLEQKRWTVEDVVDMAEAYWEPKRAAMADRNATLRREREDAMFANALAGAV